MERGEGGEAIFPFVLSHLTSHLLQHFFSVPVPVCVCVLLSLPLWGVSDVRAWFRACAVLLLFCPFACALLLFRETIAWHSSSLLLLLTSYLPLSPPLRLWCACARIHHVPFRSVVCLRCFRLSLPSPFEACKDYGDLPRPPFLSLSITPP